MTTAPARPLGRPHVASTSARWLRFAVYVGILWFTLIAHAEAIREAAHLLVEPRYFPLIEVNVAGSLAIAVAAFGYAIWLCGATLSGWRMPLPTHLLPLALAGFTLFHGPLVTAPDLALRSPTQRATEAMSALAERLERAPGDPCALAAAGTGLPRLASGYFAHGAAVPFGLDVKGETPMAMRDEQQVRDFPTLFVRCAPDKRRFWITAAVSDAVPTGAPMLVRDGVGKVVFFAGEVKP